MRVLFIFPDLSSNTTNYTGAPSYGIAALSSVLRASGHEPDLLHITTPPDETDFRRRIAEATPDLIAFSSNSHYAQRLRTWTTWARRASSAPIAMGGIHATVAPDAVATMPEVDFICRGEGEIVLPELCDALAAGADPSGIANLWVRTAGGWTKNPLRPLIQDLDSLPDPDLGLFNFRDLYIVRRGHFPYIMSRGCGFTCTYCAASSLRRLVPGPGKFWRFLSPVAAAEQLRRLIDRHMPDAQRVQFLDAILFPNRHWLAEFAEIYPAVVGLPFSCNVRADFIDPPVAAMLKRMGCRVARLGVESGNPRLTKEVLKRRLGIDDLRHAFSLLHEQGIECVSYNMVGLPTENLTEALETVRLNAELRPDLALAFVFHPYPGTPLYDRCREAGELTDREDDHYQVSVTTRMRGFPAADVLFVQRFFPRLIRLYALSSRLPHRWREPWDRMLTRTLAGRAFPRGTIVRGYGAYRRTRTAVGQRLVRRSPALYRLLGGTDPLGGTGGLDAPSSPAASRS